MRVHARTRVFSAAKSSRSCQNFALAAFQSAAAADRRGQNKLRAQNASAQSSAALVTAGLSLRSVYPDRRAQPRLAQSRDEGEEGSGRNTKHKHVSADFRNLSPLICLCSYIFR